MHIPSVLSVGCSFILDGASNPGTLVFQLGKCNYAFGNVTC